MNSNDFYAHNYYNLYRVRSVEIAYDFTLNAEASASLHLLLTAVRDLLFKSLSAEQNVVPNEFSLSEIAIIEADMQRILKNESLYIIITESDVSSNLFSRVFTKFCNRLFKLDRFNDEKYVIETQVHHFLEKELVKLIVKDRRFMSWERIEKLLK